MSLQQRHKAPQDREHSHNGNVEVESRAVGVPPAVNATPLKPVDLFYNSSQDKKAIVRFCAEFFKCFARNKLSLSCFHSRCGLVSHHLHCRDVFIQHVPVLSWTRRMDGASRSSNKCLWLSLARASSRFAIFFALFPLVLYLCLCLCLSVAIRLHLFLPFQYVSVRS